MCAIDSIVIFVQLIICVQIGSAHKEKESHSNFGSSSSNAGSAVSKKWVVSPSIAAPETGSMLLCIPPLLAHFDCVIVIRCPPCLVKTNAPGTLTSAAYHRWASSLAEASYQAAAELQRSHSCRYRPEEASGRAFHPYHHHFRS